MKALSYDDYQRLSEGGLSVPVFRELPGDLRTPVSAFFSLGARSERAFLLESVLGAERLARYSFLGRDPIARLEVRDGKVVVQDDSGTHEATAGLMSALRERLGPPPAEIPDLPRFTGGAVGYLDLGRRAALRAAARPARRGFGHGRVLLLLPLARGVRPRAAAARADGARRSRQPRRVRPGDRACSTRSSGTSAGSAGRRTRGASSRPRRCRSRDGKRYRDSVTAAKEYIARGDIFQVVLSRQHTVDCGLDPFSVYRALRMINPSPYMYFLKDGESSICGASPEMLVRVEGRRVETRPIAGTRPRGGGRRGRAWCRASCSPTRRSAPST